MGEELIFDKVTIWNHTVGDHNQFIFDDLMKSNTGCETEDSDAIIGFFHKKLGYGGGEDRGHQDGPLLL